MGGRGFGRLTSISVLKDYRIKNYLKETFCSNLETLSYLSLPSNASDMLIIMIQ